MSTSIRRQNSSVLRGRRIPDPGNTLNNARNLGVLQSPLFANDAFQRFRNSVGGRNDLNDYYRFRLNRASNFSLRLDGLSANADVEVFRLDGRGQRTRNPALPANPVRRVVSDLTISPRGGVRRSAASGSNSESINLFRLPPGQYGVRVRGRRGARTNYDLSLFASPSARGNFNIEFDYRFDTNGFFRDPIRRANLEAAAYVWESWINEDFPSVPAGVQFTVRNPQEERQVPVTLSNPIDDIHVFVGSRSIQGRGVANAGPSGTDAAGTIFRNRINQSDFTPWAGTIQVDTTPQFTNGSRGQWFFDATPSTPNTPFNSVNFFDVTLHEIGHVLGINSGNVQSNFNQVGFAGLNARNVNRGNPIPFARSHIQGGFTIDGQIPVMSDSGSNSNFPTRADLAVLADIGYRIPGFIPQGTALPIATQGNDRIFGTVTADRINGLGGNDSIQGNTGSDILNGGPGNDIIFGEVGRDTLVGGFGNDQIQGGAGNDILIGGPGDDLMFGGANRDIFVLDSSSNVDEIVGFVRSEDRIRIPAALGYRIIRRPNSTTGDLVSDVVVGNSSARATIFHDAPLTQANFILA
ncbi:MAG: hypothetical protein AAF289_03425 [Cyanobacteria bacterium P01_A01_bin.135]